MRYGAAEAGCVRSIRLLAQLSSVAPVLQYRKDVYCSTVPAACIISLLWGYITCGIMAERYACWKHPSSRYNRRGLLSYARALLCMIGAGVRTCSAIRVRRLCCLDVYRTQSKSTHLLQDVKVRAEPRCVVVTHSCVSCRGFQRGACEVDARGCCGSDHDGVMWLLVVLMMLWGSFWWQRVGSRVAKFPPALELQGFPLSF